MNILLFLLIFVFVFVFSLLALNIPLYYIYFSIVSFTSHLFSFNNFYTKNDYVMIESNSNSDLPNFELLLSNWEDITLFLIFIMIYSTFASIAIFNIFKKKYIHKFIKIVFLTYIFLSLFTLLFYLTIFILMNTLSSKILFYSYVFLLLIISMTLTIIINKKLIRRKNEKV